MMNQVNKTISFSESEQVMLSSFCEKHKNFSGAVKTLMEKDLGRAAGAQDFVCTVRYNVSEAYRRSQAKEGKAAPKEYMLKLDHLPEALESFLDTCVGETSCTINVSSIDPSAPVYRHYRRKGDDTFRQRYSTGWTLAQPVTTLEALLAEMRGNGFVPQNDPDLVAWLAQEEAKQVEKEAREKAESEQRKRDKAAREEANEQRMITAQKLKEEREAAIGKWIKDNGSDLLKERFDRELEWAELFAEELLESKFELCAIDKHEMTLEDEDYDSPPLELMKIYDAINEHCDAELGKYGVKGLPIYTTYQRWTSAYDDERLVIMVDILDHEVYV